MYGLANRYLLPLYRIIVRVLEHIVDGKPVKSAATRAAARAILGSSKMITAEMVAMVRTQCGVSENTARAHLRAALVEMQTGQLVPIDRRHAPESRNGGRPATVKSIKKLATDLNRRVAKLTPLQITRQDADELVEQVRAIADMLERVSR